MSLLANTWPGEYKKAAVPIFKRIEQRIARAVATPRNHPINFPID